MARLSPSRVRLAEEPALRPVDHQSLPEAVVADLRRAIVSGVLPHGERLIEIEFAAKLQVSRATLRRALRQLEYEGLVDILPRRGAVVARMSSDIAAEVCEVRGLLEGRVARDACQRPSDAEIEQLRSMAQSMGAAIRDGDVLRLVEVDIAFHRIICEQSPNKRLILQWKQLNSLHAAVLVSRFARYECDWQLIIDLHLELCDVLKRHDPDEAEHAVHEHYAVQQPEQESGGQPIEVGSAVAGSRPTGDGAELLGSSPHQ